MSLSRKFLVIFTLVSINALSTEAGVCDDPTRSMDTCLKMKHLRAEIQALDAQRELMQVNASLLRAMGNALSTTANDILKNMGVGIPEHRMGLTGVARLGSEMASRASKKDSGMLVTANQVRAQCATCHSADSRAGGEIFKNDWSAISAECNREGKNPYLCKSMYGMLSAYGYLLTGYNSGARDFEMTRHAADEVIRILEDLKAKGFEHLSEKLRLQAETAAQQVSALAANEDSMAFEKSAEIANACMECHDQFRMNREQGRGFSAAPLRSWLR